MGIRWDRMRTTLGLPASGHCCTEGVDRDPATCPCRDKGRAPTRLCCGFCARWERHVESPTAEQKSSLWNRGSLSYGRPVAADHITCPQDLQGCPPPALDLRRLSPRSRPKPKTPEKPRAPGPSIPDPSILRGAAAPGPATRPRRSPASPRERPRPKTPKNLEPPPSILRGAAAHWPAARPRRGLASLRGAGPS